MDYKKIIRQLEYYGTTYAIGDNLDKVIYGTDDLLFSAANAIKSLMAQVQKLDSSLSGETIEESEGAICGTTGKPCCRCQPGPCEHRNGPAVESCLGMAREEIPCDSKTQAKETEQQLQGPKKPGDAAVLPQGESDRIQLNKEKWSEIRDELSSKGVVINGKYTRLLEILTKMSTEDLNNELHKSA